MSNQAATIRTLSELLEANGLFESQSPKIEISPVVPLVIVAILILVGLNFITNLTKAESKRERQHSKETPRSHIPVKPLVKNVSRPRNSLNSPPSPFLRPRKSSHLSLLSLLLSLLPLRSILHRIGANLSSTRLCCPSPRISARLASRPTRPIGD